MQRIVDLKLERNDHSKEYGRTGRNTQLTSADGEYTFNNIEDLTFYERLTGHIEEVQYLIKAFA